MRRDGENLLFVSERDGNMELYKGHLKHAEDHRHSFKRLTYSPSLQVGYHVESCYPNKY